MSECYHGLTIWAYYRIYSHMKTTIDLPDEILHRAKVVAAQRRTSLKELFLSGLEMALKADAEQPARQAALVRLQQGLKLGGKPLSRKQTHDASKFLDTNILLYAYDLDAPVKRTIAQRLIELGWSSPGELSISVQVLQEMKVNLENVGYPKRMLHKSYVISPTGPWWITHSICYLPLWMNKLAGRFPSGIHSSWRLHVPRAPQNSLLKILATARIMVVFAPSIHFCNVILMMAAVGIKSILRYQVGKSLHLIRKFRLIVSTKSSPARSTMSCRRRKTELRSMSTNPVKALDQWCPKYLHDVSSKNTKSTT